MKISVTQFASSLAHAFIVAAIGLGIWYAVWMTFAYVVTGHRSI